MSRYTLLDQPEVLRRLAEADWFLVPDSGSGPVRGATELGLVLIEAGKRTMQDDGTPYEPIEVRVVVTRIPQPGEAKHGRVIDGWQYELFTALDIDPVAWPAPEVTALYFGRGGEENRLGAAPSWQVKHYVQMGF